MSRFKCTTLSCELKRGHVERQQPLHLDRHGRRWTDVPPVSPDQHEFAEEIRDALPAPTTRKQP